MFPVIKWKYLDLNPSRQKKNYGGPQKTYNYLLEHGPLVVQASPAR